MINIDADKISIDYPIIGMGGMSLKNRIIGTATGGMISTNDHITVVNALRDVTFRLSEGDRLGLVGHNGAGKSTLLKVLAGIYTPTNGSLTTTGNIVSTLNLSLGMEQDATGYENIVIRGLLLGMKRKEIENRIDEIAEFTELGAYLNMPVRIYSSGMLTRLAFATVTSMDADILLMDEVIGTGDAAFIDKAEKRLNDFMSRCKILVLASHSEAMIRQFCNKAALFNHGQLISVGSVDDVFDQYNKRNIAG